MLIAKQILLPNAFAQHIRTILIGMFIPKSNTPPQIAIVITAELISPNEKIDEIYLFFS